MHFLNKFISLYLAYQISNNMRIAVITMAYLISPNFMVLPSSSKTHLVAPFLPLLPLRLTQTQVTLRYHRLKREQSIKEKARGHFLCPATIFYNSSFSCVSGRLLWFRKASTYRSF